jgi:hypothetical protein
MAWYQILIKNSYIYLHSCPIILAILLCTSILLFTSIRNVNALENYNTNQTLFNKNSSVPSESVKASINTNGQQNAGIHIKNDPQNPWLIFASFVISIAIIFTIFAVVNKFLRDSKMEFGDILRDGRGFPSLARFQFLLWTFVTSFSVTSVFFIRMFMGTPQLPNDIPQNLLILTGISIAVPFVSNPLSTAKYGARKPTATTLQPTDRRRLATMLMENEKITVSRFQMFLWTWISIIIYLAYFFSQTTFLLVDANKLIVPDIPQIFVYLMGLSQAGYIGNKATLPESLTVTQIIPPRGRAGQNIKILGTNFGSQKDGVLFEDGAKDITGNQIFVQQQNIVTWQDDRIEITVSAQGLTPGNDYYIRVQKGGVVSHKAGGNDDEAKFTMQ